MSVRDVPREKEEGAHSLRHGWSLFLSEKKVKKAWMLLIGEEGYRQTMPMLEILQEESRTEDGEAQVPLSLLTRDCSKAGSREALAVSAPGKYGNFLDPPPLYRHAHTEACT